MSVIVLTLTGLGVYGVSLYITTLRQREIGVRLLIGARPRHILGVAVWHQVRGALVGSGIGLGGTLVVARALAASSDAFILPGLGDVVIAVVLVMIVVVLASGGAARAFSQAAPVALLR